MDKEILQRLTYGLYLISSNEHNKLVGCIVNTVVQITSEDPILSVSVNKNNYTNKVLKEQKKIAINILSSDIDPDIIKIFGFQSSKNVNKFLDVSYSLIDEMPILKKGICGYIIGDIIDIIDVNTHNIFLIKVTNLKKVNDNDNLTYDYYRKFMKGKSPKNAPTYIEEKVESDDKVYRCMICGHLYKDSENEVKFADLPDDWVCPVCGVGKDKFERIQ